MTCELAQLPPWQELDIPALRERYRRERGKRLRPEQTEQHVQPVVDFAAA